MAQSKFSQNDGIGRNWILPNLNEVYNSAKTVNRDTITIAKTLLDSGVGSDVTFIFMEEGLEVGKIEAHRIILSLRSPVFATMFGIEMKEAIEGIVRIEDMTKKVMRILFIFIYCGEVDEGWTAVAEELVYGAEKYDLEGLKKFLDENLATLLTVENLLEMWKLACNHNLQVAQDSMVEFLQRNAREFLEHEYNIYKNSLP